MSFDLSAISQLSVEQTDRLLLSLFRERMKKSSEEKAEEKENFTSLLHEEEQKSIGSSAKLLAFLHAADAFSKNFPKTEISFYENLVEEKVASTENEIPQLAKIGFLKSEKKRTPFRQKSFSGRQNGWI